LADNIVGDIDNASILLAFYLDKFYRIITVKE